MSKYRMMKSVHMMIPRQIMIVPMLLALVASADQKLANLEASTFVLSDIINTDMIDADSGNLAFDLTAMSPQPGEAEAQKSEALVFQGVRLNKIGLARVNAERERKGLPMLIAGEDVQVAPFGEDLITVSPEELKVDSPYSASEATYAELELPLFSDEGGIFPADLPGAVDNSTLQYFPPIKNQGTVNSCAQWAGIYYTMTHEMAMTHGWNAKTGGDFYRFSPSFVYNMVLTGEDGGSNPNGGWIFAKKHGMARMSEFHVENDYKTWCMDSNVYRRALEDRIEDYGTISAVNTPAGLENLKTLLNNGHVAVCRAYIGGWQYKALSNDPGTSDDDAYAGEEVVYYYNGSLGYDHYMTVVGYNDSIWCDTDNDGIVDANEKGALLIANSWGTGWKNDGFVWVSYNTILNENAFKGSSVNFITTYAQPHVPKVIARFTINHNIRSQIYMSPLGTGPAGSTSPEFPWLSPVLVAFLGTDYAFDGSAPTYQDFTYYVDYDDVLPTPGENRRWFVEAYDNSGDGNRLTLKSFDLFRVDGASDTLVGSAAGLPIVLDGGSQMVWVEWTYDPPTNHTITASADAGGTISPAGAVVVSHGSDQSFSITPNTGYAISDVVVDSVPIGATNSYTFYSVATSHVISAFFDLTQYTVVFDEGDHGYRSGGGALTQQVNHGSAAVAPTMTPETNYVFMGWDQDFSSVTSNMTITAQYALDEVLVVNQGASALSETSAALMGTLSSGADAQVWICWGLSDGGTSSTGDWQQVVAVGPVDWGASFATNVAGLATNTTYYYRCYASGTSGTDWSDAVTAFSGVPAGDVGSASNSTLTVIDVFCHNEKENFGGAPVDMISGSGMNGNPSDYSGSWPTNDPSLWIPTDNAYQSEWQSQGMLDPGSSANAKIGWAIFDLGDIHTLDKFYIWNERENSARYTATFNVYVSAAPTVPPAHGPTDSTSLDYDFAGGGWTKINDSLLTGSYRGNQVVDLGGSSARYVAVEILTNGGDGSRVGLAEVGVVASIPQSPPIANLAVSGISEDSAMFNAALNAMGTNYEMYAYWGVNDGGTNAGLWATNAYVYTWTNVLTNISYTVNGLDAGQSYFYTFMVSNETEIVWASPSWTFTTLPAVSSGSVTTNHAVPHIWLTTVNPAWTNDFESIVTNDWDGDGFTTAQEYWAGTDPTDSASYLKIDSIEFSGGYPVLRWQHAAVDASLPPICIQGRTNLVAGAWEDAVMVSPQNGDNVWSNTVAPYPYYRILVPAAQ